LMTAASDLTTILCLINIVVHATGPHTDPQVEPQDGVERESANAASRRVRAQLALGSN